MSPKEKGFICTPMPSFRALSWTLLVSVRISVPDTEVADEFAARSTLASPSEAAVVPPSTSWTVRSEACSPVVSVKTISPLSVEAVTPIVPALLIASTTSSMFWALERSMTRAGAAAVGDANFAGQ